MKKYKRFIIENFEPITSNKGKLSVETGDENDSDWKFKLVLEKTWKQFIEKTITLLDFNNIYAATLIENQQQISEKCGEVAWSSIEPIVVNELRSATTPEDSEKVYNKLYDVFDKYEIFIETGSVEEIFESMEQQNYSVGDIVIIDFYGEEKTARISKINTKNSVLIQIEDNTHFLEKEHEIKIENIISLVSSNESPATVSDWNQPLKQKPSNDMAIHGNGTPGVPAPGTPFN
jgi:hypothetical protein